MTQKGGTKKKPLGPGKKDSSPASAARVERRKKGAGKKSAVGSLPKEAKGEGGRRGGGLH